MRLETIAYTILGISLVILLGTTVWTFQVGDYGVEYDDEDLEETFDDFHKELENVSGSMKGALYSGEEEDPSEKSTGGVIRSIAFIWNSKDILYNMVVYAQEKLYMPAIVTATLSIFLGIAILFGMVYILFRIRSW